MDAIHPIVMMQQANMTSEREKLSVCQTHSSTAKKYNGERRGSVASITSVSSVTRGYPSGVEDTLAALEGRREEYAKSPELKVQA
ncbi:unnamed protein product [Rhizophagus irregularis]|uniref:Uncharacterized protein n=1 Tax=Rhizophagus irregularis TaxID=588596 RepID=A0A916DY16_9GLOM|nr:unnamed protein product [Rhizophagus irregularis]